MKKPTVTRRTFLQGLVVVLATGPGSCRHELRDQFQLESGADVLMILSAHVTPRAAERWRREYAVRPFDTLGEWYLQSVVERDLPTSLADVRGSLMQCDYIAGVAAVESSMLVGAFRREHISCVYRVRGETDDVIALGEDFASRTIPMPFELLWRPDRLEAFIPTTDRLGMDVSPSETFWP